MLKAARLKQFIKMKMQVDKRKSVSAGNVIYKAMKYMSQH